VKINLSTQQEEKLGPKPTVKAALEDWDDTTDVIVWLVQKEFADITLATLELEDTPNLSYRHTFDYMDSQTATLEGWPPNHSKVEIRFDAEAVEIPHNEVPADLAAALELEADYNVDGYKVTVSKRDGDSRYTLGRWKPIAIYTIYGVDRTDFQIISKKQKS
jgi:hypothetical protein